MHRNAHEVFPTSSPEKDFKTVHNEDSFVYHFIFLWEIRVKSCMEVTRFKPLTAPSRSYNNDKSFNLKKNLNIQFQIYICPRFKSV